MVNFMQFCYLVYVEIDCLGIMVDYYISQLHPEKYLMIPN